MTAPSVEDISKKRWLSCGEVAFYLSLSINTIYEKVERRTIPFKRIPHSNQIRFDRLRIDKWLDEGE